MLYLLSLGRTVALTLAAGAFVSGCAAPALTPPSKTTVVLLPDEDGNVGAVSMSSASGSQTIEQAFDYATVNAIGSAPSNAKQMGSAAVNAAFGELLKAQPLKPKTFVLYFRLNSTELTDESKAMLAAVLRAARERKPTEITIFGHADSSGTAERNLRLSAERANVVADLLEMTDPKLGTVDVQFFGDKAPLVPSAPGAVEARNRRAEIMIL